MEVPFDKLSSGINIGGVLLLLVALLLAFALWKLPQWQVAHSKGVTTHNEFDRRNEARKTLAQIIGGVVVLAGLYSSIASLDTAREGQITDRFTKAIDQLGSIDSDGKPRLEIRLGGIYALERIARDSKRDRWAVLEVLSAYVRQNSARPNESDVQEIVDPSGRTATTVAGPRPDIQAIVSVLTEPGLAETDADRKVSLSHANLRGAILNRANFARFDLTSVDLSDAYLVDSNLEAADLSGSLLARTHLSGSRLENSKLTGVDLTDARMEHADFRNAELTGADLLRADLQGAMGLLPEQISTARIYENTVLPAELRKGITQ